MNQRSRSLFVFLMLMLLALVPACKSEAADNYPGNVTNLKYKKVSDTSVQLSWSNASGATGYKIYSVDPDTGKTKKVASTTATSYTVKSMQIGQLYQFEVYALKKSGSETYMSKNPSNVVSVTLKLSTPGAIKNFRLVCNGNKSAFLAWDAAKNADKYIIYRYDSASDTYKKIGTTTETTYQAKKLTAGQKYYFKVRAYHTLQGKEAYGKLSDKVTVKAKTIDLTAVHGRYVNATLKKKTTVTVSSTGKKKTLSKGTAIIATKKSTGTITALLKNGTKITINGSNLSYGNLYTTSKKYTTAQKEAFVNGKGYSSKTDYLIWISQYTLETNVFKGSKGKWKLVRSMQCVVGSYGMTPQGKFEILNRVGWLNGARAYYFTWNSRLGGGNAFHCRLNGKVTGALSHGCVRLGSSDLNYIGTYCKPGTTVISY